MQPHVLVVDDDIDMGDTCRRLLEKRGLQVTTARNGIDALDAMQARLPDLVLSDVRMPGMEGGQLLQEIKKRHAEVPVILMTGFGSIQSAVEALKMGAADYITKPFTREELLASVERALELKTLRGEVVRLRHELQNKYAPTNIIGSSKGMQQVFERIRACTRNDATVLITGENGTGKDLVAQAIHYGSSRSGRPFIAINCGALPRDLIESELFGHRKGSFTGALHDNPGVFRAAEGGTLFLDEVAEMPLDLQVKLLRALQERKVRPVGESTEYPVNVRVIAATNRDVHDMLQGGTLRQDLYYRLSVVTIHVPSLRERVDDIPLLVQHFLKKHTNDNRIEGFSKEAMRALERYPWPGNVRELENVIEGLVALGAKGYIEESDLGDRFQTAMAATVGAGAGPGAARQEAALPFNGLPRLEDAERRLIETAIERCGGNKSKAAELLGISRTRLYRKLREIEVSG